MITNELSNGYSTWSGIIFELTNAASNGSVGLSFSSSKILSVSDKVSEALLSASIVVLAIDEFSPWKKISNEPITSANVRLINEVHTLGTRRVPETAEVQISAGVLHL